VPVRRGTRPAGRDRGLARRGRQPHLSSGFFFTPQTQSNKGLAALGLQLV